MKHVGICLPSYNESQNIISLIYKILDTVDDVIICVVDDNSPDKTYDLVKQKFNKNEKIKIIKRETKDGRGSAVWDGFKYLSSLHKNIDIFIEMDCDFSHSIEDLNKGIKIFKNNKCDVLLGSRYPNGIIINWSLKRRIFSFLANLLI